MKRAATTFTQVLGLIAATLVVALALAAALSRRTGRDVVVDAYGRLATAAAMAADALADRAPDTAATDTLAALRAAGVDVVHAAPPPPARRLSPTLAAIGAAVGTRLGDASRVVATEQAGAQLWIRSARTPGRWVVIHAGDHRRRVLGSTLQISLLAGLVALLAAGLAARLLTRPLEQLAGDAHALLGGAAPARTLQGGTREVHRLATAIGAAGARLRAAAHERELMLAGISHDLRTPLARLRLALELGDAADPRRRDAMVADLDELDGALEQCLAFVRDGRDEPLRATDLATLAGQLLALRAQPEDWQYAGPAGLELSVRRSLLRRAVGNLMDNAEKHGRAPFTVTLAADAGGVLLEVADRGPGVPASVLPRLGRPFVRADAARGGTGTGLGLSIAARAAELHGGALRLAHRGGGGLRVGLWLPRAPS